VRAQRLNIHEIGIEGFEEIMRAFEDWFEESIIIEPEEWV
jgi:hypothetical protein